jgi:hypothetical protein
MWEGITSQLVARQQSHGGRARTRPEPAPEHLGSLAAMPHHLLARQRRKQLVVQQRQGRTSGGDGGGEAAVDESKE